MKKVPEPHSFFQKVVQVGALILLALSSIGVMYYLVIVRNPLPSDEKMMAHFHDHRVDFEELVRRYRNFDAGPDGFHSKWKKQDGTKDILERAKTERIFYTDSAWFPEPYSLKTAKALKKARGKGSIEISRKYGALVLSLLPRNHYRATNLNYLKVWKDFTYFPEVPRIKNGKLLWPVNIKGQYSKIRRTFPTLNEFPDHWKDYECVYRQIEPQWFIRMCNGH